MKSIVTACNLRKFYGSYEALAGISFSIDPGSCFGILGPNGARKTTTVGMIYCFLPVDDGTLTVLGKDVTQDARHIKSRLGIVPQENNLDLELSVLDNLLVYASYFGISGEVARRRAGQQLDFFGLKEKRDVEVDALSGGMKRRLTIARGMMNDPEILVLDEPTTGLDPEARHHIWQHLRYLRDNGLTIILTTHYLEEASQLCDTLLIMDEGHILEEGTPTDLVHKHIGTKVLEVGMPKEEFPALLNAAGHLRGYLFLGDTAYLHLDGASGDVADRISQLPQLTYQLLRPANLEDVFLKLTGRGMHGD